MAPHGYTMLRLTVTDAVNIPVIWSLAAYNVGAAPPKTWADQAPLWADDAVGTWNSDSLSLDLTAKVTSVGQCRLRLVAPGDDAVEIRSLELSIGGSPQPALVRTAPGRRDVAILTIPEAGDRVTLRLRLRGAQQGIALLQRL